MENSHNFSPQAQALRLYLQAVEKVRNTDPGTRAYENAMGELLLAQETYQKLVGKAPPEIR